MAAVLAIALAGCSDRRPGSSIAPPTADEALPVQTAPAEGAFYLPWSLDRVDEQDNRVYLTTSNLDCSTPSAAEVTETTTTVTIRIIGSAPHQPCTEQAIVLRTHVDLPSPLADRELRGQQDH